jgi:nucleoside-diphosphate-sugar epimerase
MDNNNEKILITGGAGFVGHHMIEYFLKHTNYDIVSLDRLDTSGNLNRLVEILKDNIDKRNMRSIRKTTLSKESYDEFQIAKKNYISLADEAYKFQMTNGSFEQIT